MALDGMGPILPYYWEKLLQINLQTGETLGLTYIICFLAILTLIVLCFLAALILKARSHAPENRFMAILLLAEGYRVMASWYNAYPFSAEMLPLMEYYRVGWYFCSLLCLFMYLSTVSFYPTKRLDFMANDKIRNNLWWALPAFTAIIIAALIYSSGGVVEAFGGNYHIECNDVDEEVILTSTPGSPPIEAGCVENEDYLPYSWFIPGSTGASKILLLAPPLSAIVAAFLMRGAWRRLGSEDGRENDANEARALFIGFSGKATIKGLMVLSITIMTIKFGDFNLADLASIEGDLLPIYLYCLYGFLFSILLTGMFEGFMFSYAILKNDILGIDEQLRRSMSWGVFVFTGAICILVVAELLEGIIPYGGIASALVVGVPLTVMRKPIYNTINMLVIILMPEAFTKEENSYLEAYSMVMDDGILTDNERKLLTLQAKNLGLDEARVEYLETWYTESLESSDEEE
ncbi:MAG: hypothetical protein VX627_05890 [Candidatus Thermoplasmatota archaeon]|nr:hypothetical protein [Candidatus Thermoplasmatota archaeon]